MMKDRDGFMWFGTWNGLNRFDGHTFVVYKSRPGDTSSLKNDRVQDIVEDNSGYLWVRTYDNRIYRFDKKTEQFLAIGTKVNTGNKGQPVYNKIILSKNGQIWLTTQSDGVFFIPQPGSPHPVTIHYSAEINGPKHLPANNIGFLFEDIEGNIWIGTPGGICCLQKQGSNDFNNINIKQPQLPPGSTFIAAVDTRDKVWLSTTTGDLFYFDKSTRKFYSKKISTGSLQGVYPSKKINHLYITTTSSELITLDEQTLQTSVSVYKNAGQLGQVTEDHNGLLWIEPERYGIVKYDPQNNTFKHFIQKTDAYYDKAVKFYRVTEDKNGLVWINMENGGFGYYDPVKDAVDYFYDEPGSGNYRFSNVVVCIYSDPSGVLWLNADDKGLNKIVFQRNDFNQQLVVKKTVIRSDNEIRGICNDSDNRLWLASKAGSLYVYQNHSPVNIKFLNLPKDGIGVVYSMVQDKKGAMWFGTRGNGLFKAEPTGKIHTTYKLSHFLYDKNNIYSLSSNLIYSVFEDKQGQIWVGSYDAGLDLVDQQHGLPRFINTRNSFKNYPKNGFVKIRHMQQDANGKLWVATTDGLLVVNANGLKTGDYRFTTFSKKAGDIESLGKNDIQFIFRDSKNNMWLCTSGGGLEKAIGKNPFKGLKFKVFTTESGLTSDYVLSCVEDNKGYLWLSTENGLSKFDPRTEQFRNYYSYDGLPQTGFSEASGLELPGGDLVFGGITGYVYFAPDKIVNHPINANMVFTNLQINNKDVITNDSSGVLHNNIDQTQHLKLDYFQNIISIDYTVLDYRLSNKQTYAYRMVGFDKTWHDNQNQRRATYTNLPAGDYTFEVKSLSDQLYVTQPYKKLTITIFPAPWRTWWAYLLYIAFAIVMIEIARRIALTMLKLRHRIAVEQKLADLKLSFFTNVSHELRTPLTLILNPIEEISKRETLSTQGNEHINVVRKNAKRMVRFINQLLDLRKVQSGKAVLKVSQVEIVSFVTKISEYFTDVAHEKSIKLNIEANKNEIFAFIDAEKIDIVIYNLLANAFKFTPYDKNIKVLIRSSVNQNKVSIEIADQGQGVTESKLNDIFELYYEGDHCEGKNLKGTGIGLALSKELVELHHGKISARNNADQGLSVTVELLLGKEHLTHDEVIFIDLPEVPHEFEEAMDDMLQQSIGHPAYQHNNTVPMVLLVEDNNDLRMFLNTQLSEFYRVELAENGEEGLIKANKLLPDLVLSDVMMPKMDGIQLLDKLKNDIQTSHIPVVLLSAKFSIESQIEGLNYGADYYITKPFHNDFLLASIENLIKQRKKIFESFLNGRRTIELNPGEIVITSHDELFLKKIISIVEDRMSDPDFNIEAVAESLNMGRSTFYKKFKSLTNVAPVEFMREMRLKRAKQLLDAGENNISEIAYTVGFNNGKYFSTCFKDQYQLSPSEYLKAKAFKV
jgi:signal transduction histidine kinase/ligand-binding sensor domain-containing protein/CheY-like chemotaxis protein/AraC-like DNA-binding protein